jgi:RNA polymerase sigma-70 factor (ECF subfamily)
MKIVSAALDTSEPVAPVGPPPDFDGVYDSELAYVWGCLRRLGVPDRDLEDLAHDVFVVVHDRLRTYDPRRPLRPWLFGIAFRVASHYRRSARHRREVPSEHVERAPDPSAEDAPERRELRALLIEALDTIPLERRAVLVLHDLDGATAPQIAEALEIPLNTVYSRLRTARQELAGSVERVTRERRRR